MSVATTSSQPATHPTAQVTPIRIVLRDGRESEFPWLYSSWLRSFQHSDLTAHVHRDRYYKSHHDLIDRLLKRASFRVAVTPDDTDTALGWIVREPDILHYILIKEGFRHQFGLFESLMSDLLDRGTHPDGFRFTHRTSDVHMRLRKWVEDEAILTGKCPSSPHRLNVIRVRDPEPGSPSDIANRAGPATPKYRWECASRGCHYHIVRDTNRDPPRPPLAIYDPYEAFR